MIEVLAFMKDQLSSGQPVAMVVLTESEAHTPGRSGAIMAVTREGQTSGTVGGGTIEHDLTKQAVAALANGQGITFSHNLKKDYGMLCGGQIKGYISILNAGERLILFGGGHVAQAVAKVAETAGFLVVVVEDRPEFKESFSPTVQYHFMNPLEAPALLQIGASDYCVIVTRGHEHDQAMLTALVERDLAYLGMIGSRPKVAAVFAQMEQQGISKNALDRVYSPIGLHIDNGSLGEIAISIVAELLSVKNNLDLRHRRDQL